MDHSLPTRKIIHKESGDMMVINETDFDEALHEEFSEKPVKKAEAKQQVSSTGKASSAKPKLNEEDGE